VNYWAQLDSAAPESYIWDQHPGNAAALSPAAGFGNETRGIAFRDASMIRVACYIDGFNIYHAVDDMSRATRGADNYLKGSISGN
jgi:hypothetical protein